PRSRVIAARIGGSNHALVLGANWLYRGDVAQTAPRCLAPSRADPAWLPSAAKTSARDSRARLRREIRRNGGQNTCYTCVRPPRAERHTWGPKGRPPVPGTGGQPLALGGHVRSRRLRRH